MDLVSIGDNMVRTISKPWFSLLIITFYLLIITSPLFALDPGLMLDQSLEIGGIDSDAEFVNKGIIIPRLSGLIGDNGGFYLSAGMNYQFEPVGLVPELLRTDFNWRSGSFDFRIGRMLYSDPLGIIAQGLFDGARFSFDTGIGTFSAGAWYTGLLYKRRANIAMTLREQLHNARSLSINNYGNSYFAPRRVLSALEWEHQGIGAREMLMASMAVLGQFDLTDSNLHSQYLALKLGIPIASFAFNLGGCFETLGLPDRLRLAYAAELEIAWRTRFQRLSLLGRYSSGKTDYTVAFLPLSSIAQGYILKPSITGVSSASLDYTARLHRTFSIGLSSFYFILNDLETFSSFRSGGNLLGAEFYGMLYWNPFSDLSINLGGGVFLPTLGNSITDIDNLWSVELKFIFSFL